MNRLVDPTAAKKLSTDILLQLRGILYDGLHWVYGLGLLLIVLCFGVCPYNSARIWYNDKKRIAGDLMAFIQANIYSNVLEMEVMVKRVILPKLPSKR